MTLRRAPATKMRMGLLALCWAAVVCPAVPAGADDVAAFYRGRQIRIVVGSAAGGGYDLFARIVARHMVGHIPGNPSVIVQNLPSAGGMVMTNQLIAAEIRTRESAAPS
jgi:tripartite-type tricarboxylate transporter receptor subunit TctC